MSGQNPWAMTQVSDRLPIAASAYAHVGLDASTQAAVYTDTAGRAVEMGAHGTNKTQGTTSQSGGSDGARPVPATNDDNNVDYVSD